MNAVDQHPRDLVLALFQSAPTFPMTVLRSATVDYDAWRVEANVIGESHAMVFKFHGEPVFSEVLACYPLAHHRAYYAYEFINMNDHAFHYGPYYGRVMFHQPEWDVPSLPPEQSITVRFPVAHGVVPLTRIGWHYEFKRLQWWTLHTYPLRTGTIRVYSLSQYDFGYSQGRR